MDSESSPSQQVGAVEDLGQVLTDKDPSPAVTGWSFELHK